ncbi:MAG: hypothetical protein SF052_11530 [Bacteroidia bacterium]|nr:hypothetical protein [Bacteroidia bacterium]
MIDLRNYFCVAVMVMLILSVSYSQNVFSTQYSFTRNSLPVDKGEHYIAINPIGPEVHLAITRNFSAGFTSSVVAAPVIGNMRYTIPLDEKNNLGVGLTAGSIFYPKYAGFGTFFYGSFTWGDRDNNFNFSAGYVRIQGLGDHRHRKWNGPVFSLAGMTKIKEDAFFITELLCFVENNNLHAELMPILRITPTPKSAFQIGVGIIILDNSAASTPVGTIGWFRTMNSKKNRKPKP